jgi:hypothetical protein
MTSRPQLGETRGGHLDDGDSSSSSAAVRETDGSPSRDEERQDEAQRGAIRVGTPIGHWNANGL